MKTFRLDVKCNTATELMEALISLFNRINKDTDGIDKMKKGSWNQFGDIPEYNLSRIDGT